MGYDPTLFAKLAEVEERSFWFRARNRLIVSTLRRHFPGATSMLELGTGTGAVLAAVHREFPQMRLVGSDLHDEGLSFARGRLRGIQLDAFDARRIPYQHQFDVVGAFDVLEHIEDDESVIREIARVSRGVILTVPQHPWLWSHADDQWGHVRRYTRREVVTKLGAAGFTIARATSFVTSLLPALALTRRRDGDPLDALVPRGNRILERILDAERLAIEHGVNLPVGGTLLVVAHR